MANLKQIRGSAWVSYLLGEGGFKSLAALHDSLQVVGAVQSWTSYKSGKDAPLLSTVKVVDKAIPGSADFWCVGPYGLPLWAVLGGDLNACHDLVNKQLMDYQEGERWMLVKNRRVSKLTVYEQVQAMLEITLPRSVWGFSPEVKTGGFPHLDGITLLSKVSLGELFKMEENSLYADYEKNFKDLHTKAVIEEWFETHPVLEFTLTAQGMERNKFENLKPNLVSKEFTLAYIALVHLCLASEDSELLAAANFIKNGIFKAVYLCFGESVYEYFKGI